LRSVHDCYQNLVGLTHCVFRLNLRLTCDICCYDTGRPSFLDESSRPFTPDKPRARGLVAQRPGCGPMVDIFP
jgi:hypothetical protein